MYKKTMTYTDFNGNTRTKDFYFNMTRAEALQWEMSVDGGMQALLEKISKEEDMKRMIEHFKKIIDMTYGEKSADGDRFMKSEEILNNFRATEAYSDLFMELATDAEAAAKFVNAVVPNVPHKNAAAASTAVSVATRAV